MSVDGQRPSPVCRDHFPERSACPVSVCAGRGLRRDEPDDSIHLLEQFEHLFIAVLQVRVPPGGSRAIQDLGPGGGRLLGACELGKQDVGGDRRKRMTCIDRPVHHVEPFDAQPLGPSRFSMPTAFGEFFRSHPFSPGGLLARIRAPPRHRPPLPLGPVPLHPATAARQSPDPPPLRRHRPIRSGHAHPRLSASSVTRNAAGCGQLRRPQRHHSTVLRIPNQGKEEASSSEQGEAQWEVSQNVRPSLRVDSPRGRG
jgi:hypothetical protein